MTDVVEELITTYRQLAIDWVAAEDVRSANRLIMEQQEVYRRLRGQPHGREALIELLHDPHDGVRLAAASHALAWHDPAAIAVLEELRAGDDLHALDAELTLRGYRVGAFDLDL
jgi:hypothetical protein